MPLVGSALKSKIQASVLAGLQREFAGTGDFTAQWTKIANAVSDAALDIVDALHNDATVAAGIPVATTGSPSAQTGATTAPGTIL